MVEKLSRANLEGELYLQDTENNVLDLGNLRLSGKIEKEIFTKKLMKQDFFLTNEGVVQDGKTFLAIVNTTTISEPDRTQYLYFINVAVIPIGFFVIKNITIDTITIEMEKEDGTKEEGLLRKKVGTFLPPINLR